MAVPARFWMNCRWCLATGKQGCLVCQGEANKAFAKFERENPPITIRMDEPGALDVLKAGFHVEALQKTFGPGGGGFEELRRNVEASRAKEGREVED